jgi:hypothetical protein
MHIQREAISAAGERTAGGAVVRSGTTLDTGGRVITSSLPCLTTQYLRFADERLRPAPAVDLRCGPGMSPRSCGSAFQRRM